MPEIIWIIGWLFTTGVTIDPKHKSVMWMVPLTLLLWPLLLGITVKIILEEQREEICNE